MSEMRPNPSIDRRRIKIRLQEAALTGERLQSDGISVSQDVGMLVSQDWQTRLTNVECIGSSAGNCL
jgi:hypothetical protein